MYNGKGVQTFLSKNKYVGEFVDGLFNGKGVYTFCDGRRYKG